MNLAPADGPWMFDRSVLWFSIGLVVLMAAMMIGPRVPADQQVQRCVVNVGLPRPFGFGLNCDSREFMRLARHPAGLLEPHNIRQSRPGLIVAAAGLSWALWPLAALGPKLGVQASRPGLDEKEIAGALAQYFTAFLAYVILNVVILLASFY
jgi:hypothetical protein